RRKEALQGHRPRQGRRPPCLLQPQPREEDPEAQARDERRARDHRCRRQACQADAGGGSMRVKRGYAARKKRKAALKRTKGYRGEAHSSYKRAKEALLKADSYAYRDRR